MTVINKNPRAAILLILALFVAACLVGCTPPLEEGEVIGKRYEKPYMVPIQSCSSYNSQGMCQSYMTTFIHHDEEFILVLAGEREGKPVQGDRSVPVHEYERCMKGFRYPACANPGQR